jgi:hypothetical protein
MSMIQDFVQQGIRDKPEAAAREVPEIVGHYITDNTRLNRFYQDVKRLHDRPGGISRPELARLIAAVEGWPA